MLIRRKTSDQMSFKAGISFRPKEDETPVEQIFRNVFEMKFVICDCYFPWENHIGNFLLKFLDQKNR